MGAEIGLMEMDIKRALTTVEPALDESPVLKIRSLKMGLKFYRQAKSNDRKRALAKYTLIFCFTFDDFVEWWTTVNLEQEPVLAAMFFTKFKEFLTEAITEAQTFEEIHSIWERLDDDAFRIEDGLAFQRMKVLIETTSTREVLRILFNDVDSGVLWDNYAHYEIVLLACKCATAESALETLRWLRDGGWNSEQDSYPVRLLIQKAVELYRK